jgi:hypothetical protein
MGPWAAVNIERQRQLQPNQPGNQVTWYQQLLAQQQRQQHRQHHAQQQQAQPQWATALQQSASAMGRGQGLNREQLGYQQARTRTYNQGSMEQTLGQAQHQIAAVRREAHRQAQARAHAQHLAATQTPNPLARPPSESMTAAMAAAVAFTGPHHLRPLIASPQLSAAAASATAAATATGTVPAFTSAFSSAPAPASGAAAAGSQSQMQGHAQL